MADQSSNNKNERLINQRPFLGLRSFEEKNKSQFGGRHKEIKGLFRKVEQGGLTIVFGKSGIGKTSLLKAGLLPELRQSFFFPIYFRLDFSSDKSPLQQLHEVVFNEMRSKDASISDIGSDTLWEYFHKEEMLGGLLTPVLILDQFEETFTVGEENKKDVHEMIVELADLAENRIPLVVQQEYRRKGETVPSVYGEQNYRVILSLREDYLARLEELQNFMPSIMDSRFRVVQMTIEQALDAAVKPGKGLLDVEAAQEIIKKLPGVSQSDFDLLAQGGSENQKLKVEPFLLSLICDRINEKRIEKGLEKISTELVTQFNVTDVIDSFYNETIKKYDDNVEHAIEDRLLTEGGFRKLHALEELQGRFEISDQIISELVDARIIRKEIRDGVEYAELIHDVLAPVIKENRNKREVLEKERESQEQQAQEKKERSAFLRRMAIGVGLILITAVSFAIYNFIKAQNLKERYEHMVLARSLLYNAESVSRYEGDGEKAAMIARIAYRINESNKSGEALEDMYDKDFYKAMYASLVNLKEKFKVASHDRGLRTMAHLGQNNCLAGIKDGTLRMNQDTLYNFSKEKLNTVTSIAVYKENKNTVALAGTFNFILLFDLNTNETIDSIPLEGNIRKGKSIQFINNDQILLRQDSSLMMWGQMGKQKLIWNSRDERVWNERTQSLVTRENSIEWGREKLTIPDKIFQCISVSEDGAIAAGVLNGVVIIEDDRFLELKYPQIGKPSAIKFHPDGSSIVIGNKKGELFYLSMEDEDYDLEHYQSHTASILDINCNKDGSIFASASRDGAVVLWNGENWDSPPLPLDVIRVGKKERVTSVSFSDNGEYVFAGYRDGMILKWPSGLGMLDKLICNKVDTTLSDDEWLKLVKHDDLYIEDYSCAN